MAGRRRHPRLPPVAAFICAAAVGAPSAVAQADESPTGERPIDRWLVTTSSSLNGGVRPLAEGGERLFPDRDLTIGPGYWTLVREDGRTTFSFADARGSEPDRTTLAHAYLRSPEDMTVGLRLEAAECAALDAWLNGQRIPEPGGPLPVRLAGGWNTLLLAVEADADCDPALSATLGRPDAPVREDGEPAGPETIEVQASRPPGARPNHPEGVLRPGTPRPTSLVWDGDELLAEVAFTVTSWGAPPGATAPSEDDEIPTDPPAVDLSGEWEITLYTPTGILTAAATLQMADDGALEGRMEGERIEGDIRDGWVSGEQFGWTIRLSGRGRGAELELRGVLTDGSMSGTLDFGGFRDFDARFEGQRAGVEEPDVDEPAEAEEPEAADLPRVPAPGDPDTGADDRDALAAPPDPDGLRARIIRQLLPTPDRVAARAPTGGELELEVGGRDIEAEFEGLAPLEPAARTARIEFDRVVSAALEADGVEARLTWPDGDAKFVGRIAATEALAAVHGPIVLAGWAVAGPDGFSGTFRVPDRLDGFTLRLTGGEWLIDGSPAAGGLLCDPCESGRRLRLEVEGVETPAVEIANPGYPGADGGTVDRPAGAPAAEEWLEAFRRDGERYRELGLGGAGSGRR